MKHPLMPQEQILLYYTLSASIQMFMNTDLYRGAEFLQRIKSDVESRRNRRRRGKRIETDMKNDRRKDMQELSSMKLCPSLCH
jgi:hypothetical protein